MRILLEDDLPPVGPDQGHDNSFKHSASRMDVACRVGSSREVLPHTPKNLDALMLATIKIAIVKTSCTIPEELREYPTFTLGCPGAHDCVASHTDVASRIDMDIDRAERVCTY